VSSFKTTNWSLILRAADDGPPGREALATLCETYWYPVYAFVRRSGYEGADAEDLTQAYFERFLEKRFLDQVRPREGRFRAFILVSLQHFLSNERDRNRALKRGGGQKLVSLDAAEGEARLRLEPADSVTPEVVFERAWARAVLDQALARLHAESQAEFREHRFERLRPFITGDEPNATYGEIAAEWAVGESAVRVAVHRLRRRFGRLVRQEVGRTILDPNDLEKEIRHLLSIGTSP
jgi:RNA polymerase sigma-70 factor (ECF subfamily)